MVATLQPGLMHFMSMNGGGAPLEMGQDVIKGLVGHNINLSIALLLFTEAISKGNVLSLWADLPGTLQQSLNLVVSMAGLIVLGVLGKGRSPRRKIQLRMISKFIADNLGDKGESELAKLAANPH